MSRHYLVYASTCEAFSLRGSRDGNKDTARALMTGYCPYMRGCSVTTGTAQTPVWFMCGAFDDRY